MQMPGRQVLVCGSTLRRCWLPLIVVLLGGCASGLLKPPAAPPVHTYLLEWQENAPASLAKPDGPSLLVSPMLAAPGFGGSDMAYMRAPHQLEYFATHRWVDAPARMLEPLLIRAAAHSGLYGSVVGGGTGMRHDLRLDSRLLYLRQACLLEPSQLQLAVAVSLVDVASARVLATETLSVSEPLAERTPYAGVEAANRAVARLLADLQAFLAAQAAGWQP